MRGLKVWKIIGATHWPSAFVIRHLGAISQAISGSNRPSICFLHQYTATRNIAFICSFIFFTRLYPNLGKWVVSALSKENLNNSAQKTSLAQMYTVCLVSELDIICWICSILTDSVLGQDLYYIWESVCICVCWYSVSYTQPTLFIRVKYNMILRILTRSYSTVDSFTVKEENMIISLLIN